MTSTARDDQFNSDPDGVMTFDPMTNRIQTMHLTPEERTALEVAIKEHGWVYSYDAMPFESPKCYGQLSWLPNYIYRAKPAPTIMVNGIAVPEPVREPLRNRDDYFCAAPCFDNYIISNYWCGDQIDYNLLSRGLIHLTEAAAITHARAMCAPGMREGV